MKKLRIVFMGTPEFAVGILDAILKNNFEVVGVITAADKPAGRGQQLKFSAVKQYALHNNLKVLQPINLKDDNFIQELESLKANLQVVVAFRMLPEAVWAMPEHGTFNLHASLLPNYRGAAPINWAIINGETKTGVTTFFIDDKIDTGAVILISEIIIEKEENAGSLHDKLMIAGSKLVLQTLNLIENDNANPILQHDNESLKSAPKLSKDNCKIDWSKSGATINNHIRGLSPFPTAWTIIQDKENEWTVKIDEAHFEKEFHELEIGQIVCSKKELKIAITNGFIVIESLQFPGKKKLKTFELLNGMTLSENAKAL